MNRKTKLTRWVETHGGAITIAKRLGISAHSVRTWMRGENWPTIKMGRRLVRLSGGKLTPKDVFECKGGPVV